MYVQAHTHAYVYTYKYLLTIYIFLWHCFILFFSVYRGRDRLRFLHNLFHIVIKLFLSKNRDLLGLISVWKTIHHLLECQHESTSSDTCNSSDSQKYTSNAFIRYWTTNRTVWNITNCLTGRIFNITYILWIFFFLW